jgi:EAL domain-containing protein (putative c-di-GMP-specific phosphodiesterase class I)
VALGTSLGLETVAEGIETPDQLARLVEMGCPLGQGFLFSRPMPFDEVGRLLTGSEERTLAAATVRSWSTA